MDTNVVATQITLGAFTVALINWLKSTSLFPKIVTGKTWLIRSISIVISLAAGIGIHTAWTPAPDGTHSLIISGLSLTGVGLSLWAVVKQYTFTEIIHHSTKATSNPQFVAALAPKVAAVENLIPEKEDIIGKGKA
jgi:hypothetical protein